MLRAACGGRNLCAGAGTAFSIELEVADQMSLWVAPALNITTQTKALSEGASLCVCTRLHFALLEHTTGINILVFL